MLKKFNSQLNSVASSDNDAKEPESTVAVPEDKQVGFMILLGKFTVKTAFFGDVEWQFSEIYPSLLEATDYTAQDLCGEEFWDRLDPGGRRHAILCLKHLAQLGVPLIDVSCADCGFTGFQIASDEESLAKPEREAA